MLSGLFCIIPCTDDIVKIDLRIVSFDIPPQEVTSIFPSLIVLSVIRALSRKYIWVPVIWERIRTRRRVTVADLILCVGLECHVVTIPKKKWRYAFQTAKLVCHVGPYRPTSNPVETSANIYTVSQKKTVPVFFNNSVKHWPILIILGTQHREENWRKWL